MLTPDCESPAIGDGNSSVRQTKPEEESPGERCQLCGASYQEVYWSNDNELWREVSGNDNGGGLLCPPCFVAAAVSRGAPLMMAYDRLDKPSALCELWHARELLHRCQREVQDRDTSQLIDAFLGRTRRFDVAD